MDRLSEQIAFRARSLNLDATPLRKFAHEIGNFAMGFACDHSSAGPLLVQASIVVDEVRDDACARQLQDVSNPAEHLVQEDDRFAHGSDFTWVIWNGERHSFKKGQRAEVVKALWREWEQGGRKDGSGLTAETLGEEVNSNAAKFRVDDLFRGHSAWGPMIRRTPNGTYALYSAPETRD